MKKILSFVFTINLLVSCTEEKSTKGGNFFINSELENVNYRDFSLKNNSEVDVIFTQNVKKFDEDSKIVEYYFMTADSVKYSGGKEIVSNNEVTFLEQYIFANNIKYVADTTILKWNFIKEPKKQFSIAFNSNKSNYSFKTDVKAIAEIITNGPSDTLKIQFDNKTEYLNLGIKYKENKSISVMTYVFGEGLVYFSNDNKKYIEEYFLVDSK